MSQQAHDNEYCPKLLDMLQLACGNAAERSEVWLSWSAAGAVVLPRG